MATSTPPSNMRSLPATAIVRHPSCSQVGFSISMPGKVRPYAVGFARWRRQPPKTTGDGRDGGLDGGALRSEGRDGPTAGPAQQCLGWRRASRRDSVGGICDRAHSRSVWLRRPQGDVGFGRASRRARDGWQHAWYAVAHTALGHAKYVVGDLDSAAGVLPKAAYNESAPALMRITALAMLSLTQAELGQLERSRRSAREAMEVVEARSLHELPSVASAFTALGQSQLLLETSR